MSLYPIPRTIYRGRSKHSAVSRFVPVPIPAWQRVVERARRARGAIVPGFTGGGR